MCVAVKTALAKRYFCLTDCKFIQNSNVIRTVYLPNDNSESLSQIVKSLKLQLVEQTKIAVDQKQAFAEDRRIREEEYALNLRTSREKVAELEKMLEKQQETNSSTMKEYFQMRFTFKQNEALCQENLAKISSLEDQIERNAQAFELRQSKEVELARSSAQQEVHEYLDRFRKQIVDREESMFMLKEQYEATQKMYESKIKYWSDEYESLMKKHQSLSRRYKRDVEGFCSEISLIRKSVKNLNKNMNYAKLTAKYNADNEKLVSAPEFIALENRLARISKQLAEWKADHE